MIQITVYYHGPLSSWSHKVADTEIIAQHKLPWKWLARWKAKAIFAGLNMGRCGYVIQCGEEVLEHVEADKSALPDVV